MRQALSGRLCSSLHAPGDVMTRFEEICDIAQIVNPTIESSHRETPGLRLLFGDSAQGRHQALTVAADPIAPRIRELDAVYTDKAFSRELMSRCREWGTEVFVAG